jgi:hypothetical protein
VFIIRLETVAGGDYDLTLTARTPAKAVATCRQVLTGMSWSPEDAESDLDHVDAWGAFCDECLGCEPDDPAAAEAALAAHARFGPLRLELVNATITVTRTR